MTYARTTTGPFYHGTRADLAPGELLTPGNRSNYADRKLSWIDFSGTLDAAMWGCELARGEGSPPFVTPASGPGSRCSS